MFPKREGQFSQNLLPKIAPHFLKGWTCEMNADVNTSLGIVCQSACATYYYEECDTDDGYCYLDYVVDSQFDYVPKCA